jgi:exodeoxyribonuclease (lambda-induced)
VDAELRAKRLGKLGASEAPIIMGGVNTDSLEYLVKRKAFERVFGDPDEDGFTSAAMDRGQQVEESALDWYSFTFDVPLERQFHVEHPTIPNVSATPDGFTGSRCVEGKSPLIQAWMHTAKTGEIPSQYRWQCAWQAWCAEVAQTDYVSFHPLAERRTRCIPYILTRDDIEAMRARVILVETRIRVWMRILEN